MSFGPPPSTPPQPQWGPPPQQPPAPPRPGWARKRIVIPAAVVLLFVGAGIGASGGEDSGKKASAQPTVTVTASPAELKADAEPAPEVTVTETETVTAKPSKKPAPKVATIPGDGTFVVGDDIKAGTYKTAGAEDSVIPNCYWARLKGTSGDFEDIITNGNVKGPTTVTISSSDGAFQSTGCQTWKKVG
ncbi:hypothetical protein [Streptomyces phaeochromogenes]|uniref:hypothetical protein n=1 Tax=Streptomyces phaeochromogenes TaxID=1923 RepID=UPI003711AA16